MLHVNYIYNNNNIYTSVLWLLSYLKIYSTVVSCNLCCFASSLVAFIPLVGMLSLRLLNFSSAAFSGVLPCRLFLGCLQHFACSSPLLFRVFSCNLWLLLCLCCSAALSVTLFVCNLGCWMLSCLDAVWLADAVNLFSLYKRQRRHRNFVG